MKQKTGKIMIIASVMTLCLVTAAFAQLGIVGNPDNNQQPTMRNQMQGQPPVPRPVMDSGITGLYLLEGNKFTKYDAATLIKLGQLDLGAVAPAAATDAANPMMMPINPPVPGDFRIYNGSANEFLLVVAGGNFYKIAGDTFTIVVKTPLPLPVQPQNQNNNTTNQGGVNNMQQRGRQQQGQNGQLQGNNQQQMQGGPGMGGQQGGPGMGGQQGGPGMGGQQGGPGMGAPVPPILDLNGDTLYVLRGRQLIAINAVDGTIKATTETGNPPTQRGAGMRNNQNIIP